MNWAFTILCLASLPLAGFMAEERNRSVKAWVLVAIVIGPLAPLALFLLGDRRNGASHA